jgi:predicted regulator of Ras-like GTPase activity (Roadblock/LC7/MglB family)
LENGNGKPKVPAPPAPSAPKIQPTPASAHAGQLVLSFVELAAGWNEEVRAQLSSLPGDAKLVIPAEAVGAGLQKGKVAFPWSQVSRWLKPAIQVKVSIPDDLEFVFPLKIVAPAFVAATGAAKRLEGVEIDHSLPDFFGPTSGQMSKPQVAPPAPSAPPAPIAKVETVTEEAPVPAPSVEEAPALKLSLVREEPTPVDEAVPAPVKEAVEQAVLPTAEGALSPVEAVARACELPGVVGAVVGLEEGLVIAQKLPAGFAADTVAAFMPQIFGRLQRYAAEMQMGEAMEITIQSTQGPCHIIRNGKIYLGVIGRAGEMLPDGLGLISKQLASHTR